MSLLKSKRDAARGLRERRRELRARLAAAGLRRRLRGPTTSEILGAERSPASRLGHLSCFNPGS